MNDLEEYMQLQFHILKLIVVFRFACNFLRKSYNEMKIKVLFKVILKIASSFNLNLCAQFMISALHNLGLTLSLQLKHQK